MALVNGAVEEKMHLLNMNKRTALAAVIGVTLCIISANSVAQETIIRCGASVGHGYYLEGGIIEGDGAGWHEEWESTSDKMELKLLNDGSYDILYSFNDELNSVQQSGGDVDAIFVTEDRIMLIVRYPSGGVETYLFSLKNREVIWTDIKGGAFARMGRIMRAPCD